MGYRAPREDYAMGGPVVPVPQVLVHSPGGLDAIPPAAWQSPTAPPSQTSDSEAALIRDGFGGGNRSDILAQLRGPHTAPGAAVRVEPSQGFSRKAPVTYSGSNEPYPTKPTDVVRWVRRHYPQHTP